MLWSNPISGLQRLIEQQKNQETRVKQAPAQQTASAVPGEAVGEEGAEEGVEEGEEVPLENWRVREQQRRSRGLYEHLLTVDLEQRIQAREAALRRFAGGSSSVAGVANTVAANEFGEQSNIYLPRNNSAFRKAGTAATPAVQYTEATPLGVLDSRPKLGFKGISGKRQLVAGVNHAYSGTQFDPWIPDSTVCVGRLYIVQIVNYAIVIYNKRGKIVRLPQPLNEFFGVMPANSTRPGDFINKATCVFDASSGRFFLAAAWLSGGYRNKWDRFGQTRRNADGSTSGYGIVVAASSYLTPMMAWNVFFIPASNDGVKSHNDTAPPLRYPGRVYWGATPRITVDRFGVYLTTRQYAMQGKLGRFVGSNIYAIHKPKLYIRSSKRVVRFAIPMINFNSFPVFGLEPQSPRVPRLSRYRGQDRVFFGCIDISFTFPLPHTSLALWSLSDTSSLMLPHPTLRLRYSIINTPAYYDSDYAKQKPGPPPYDTPQDVVPPTSTSVAWFKGHVWMAFPSGYSLDPTSVPSVALVKLRPFLRGKRSFPTLVKKFGIYGVPGQSLLSPVIGFNSKGQGILAATLIGSEYFPTAAYVRINQKGVIGNSIFAVGPGQAPLEPYSGRVDMARVDPLPPDEDIKPRRMPSPLLRRKKAGSSPQRRPSSPSPLPIPSSSTPSDGTKPFLRRSHSFSQSEAPPRTAPVSDAPPQMLGSPGRRSVESIFMLSAGRLRSSRNRQEKSNPHPILSASRSASTAFTAATASTSSITSAVDFSAYRPITRTADRQHESISVTASTPESGGSHFRIGNPFRRRNKENLATLSGEANIQACDDHVTITVPVNVSTAAGNPMNRRGNSPHRSRSRMSSPYDPRKVESGAEELPIERQGAPDAAVIAEDRGASARCSIDGGEVGRQASGVNQPASRSSSGRSESRAEILPRSGSGSLRGETGLVRSASKGEDVTAHGNSLALVPVGGGWGEMLNQARGGAGGLMVPAAMAQESSDVVMGILWKWVNLGRGWGMRLFVLEGGSLSFFKLDGPDKAIVLHELQRRPGARLIGDEIRRYVRIERENGVLATSLGVLGDRTPHGQIELHVSTIRASTTDNRKFYVFGHRTLGLRTESKAGRALWMEAIENARVNLIKRLHAATNKVDVSSHVCFDAVRTYMQRNGVEEEVISGVEELVRRKVVVRLETKLREEQRKRLQLLTLLRQLEAEKVELETAVVDEKRQQGQPSSSAMLLGEEDDDADSTFDQDDGDDEGDDALAAGEGGGARKEPRLTSTVRDTDEDEGDTDSDCNDEFYEAMTEFAGQGMVKRVLDIEEVGFSYPHVPRRVKLPDPEEEEKPLSLWSVLKECMGKDMFKVSLPVNFNEPLSSSQKYLEMLEYSWLLDRAAEYGRRGNRLMRAAHVAAFAVSRYSGNEGRMHKPFNPLLGETTEGDYPDKGIRYISESVVHYPPMIAWHVDGTGWKFWGDVCPKIRFWGPSIQLDPVGVLTVQFDDGETYEWSNVTVLIQNLILGKPFVEHYGTMRIKGNRGYSARLRFKERSTFDRNPHQVRGLVQNEAGDEQGTLMGRWDQHMHYVPGDLTSKTAKEESEVLATAQLIWKKNPVQPNLKYKFTPFTITLNELTPGLKELLPPTDSRLREDQRALEEGRYDFANQEKCRLEQRQRKALKDGEPGWGPRWFKPMGPNNTWRYTGGYWEQREKRDWSGVLDLFAPEEADGDANKA
ncbi:unnamed protein product [Closterium sp. Yama58-4]|nr:unnamed protein product [Closterium sp. Yama58-4]